jgi:hypothetical protein
LSTVRFPQHTKGVDIKVIGKTIDILSKAGVLDASKASAEDMIAFAR